MLILGHGIKVNVSPLDFGIKKQQTRKAFKRSDSTTFITGDTLYAHFVCLQYLGEAQ